MITLQCNEIDLIINFPQRGSFTAMQKDISKSNKLELSNCLSYKEVCFTFSWLEAVFSESASNFRGQMSFDLNGLKNSCKKHFETVSPQIDALLPTINIRYES